MVKSKKIDVHSISAAAISVLATAVVYLPATNDKSPVLAMIFALLIGIFPYILFVRFLDKKEFKNTVFKKIFAVISSLFLIFLAAKSFSAVTDYFKEAVLYKTPYYLTVIPLFLLILYAVICGGDAVKKFTVMGFLSVAALILVLVLVSFKNLDISLVSKPSFNKPFFKTVAKYLLIIFVFSADVLVFVRKGGNGKNLSKSTALGIAVGGVLLSLVIANSVLVFGEGYAAEIKAPYASAIGTFSVGTLFTRLDGFAYFIILTVNFLKCALCVLSCEYLLLPFKIKHRKTLLFVLCSACVLLSLAL